MAGQSDATDDLISELAKLMAQDAKPERSENAAFPAFTVRIPGGDNAPLPPRFDFDSTSAPAPSQPAVAPAPVAPAPVATAAPAPKPTPSVAEDEPFHFDFDLGGTKRSEPAMAPAAPAPVAAAPAFERPVTPALAAESTVDHDSIADLIAAELLVEPTPEPEPVQPAPAPSEPVAAQSRPAPQPGANWAPTAVAPNLGAQDKPARAPLRPLNLQPAPRAEQDKFKIPPVFGLSTRSPEAVASPVVPTPETAAPVMRQPAPFVPVQPTTAPRHDDGFGGDPIDEIEHLIGRAMRVEFDQPEEPAVAQRPAPSPALRSLATPAPVARPEARPAPVAAPAPHALSGVDEAILAAAQATGAEIGWVEAPEVDEFETPAPQARRRGLRAPAMSRALAGPLVAITLLLGAGFGLYWVLGLGGETGPAPLLTADTTPVKETPEAPADSGTTQQSVVFNEIDGVVPGAEEQLVSRDQTDVNEVTQVPPPTELSEEGLANRKVRTVTVRPDGSIVSSDDSVAGSAMLPVDRPVVPAVPGAEAANPELLASTTPEPTPATAVVPDIAATPAPVPATVTPVTPGTMVPAVDAAGNALAGKSAPVPMSRPSGLQGTAPSVIAPVNAVVNTPSAGGNLLPPPPANSTLGNLPSAQPIAAAPAPVATPAASTIPGAVEVDALPNSAPAYAQLASLRSEEEARAAAQALVTRFGPLFGGANMEVQRVDLGARGVYYRVRVPANSVQAAGNICTNVIAAGGDCVPM